MGDDDLRIDPWSSAQSTDYSRIIEQFGLSPMDGLDYSRTKHLHRRGVIFAPSGFGPRACRPKTERR